jgi:hypothetical protein
MAVLLGTLWLKQVFSNLEDLIFEKKSCKKLCSFEAHFENEKHILKMKAHFENECTF